MHSVPLKLKITLAFISLVCLTTASFANQNALVWKHKNWEIYDEHGLIRYVSEPNPTEIQTEVKTFGFFKVPGSCDADYLWLVLPGSKNFLSSKLKQEFSIDLRVDPYAEGAGLNQSYKQLYRLLIEQVASAQDDRAIGQFQGVLAEQGFIKALQKGARLMLTVTPTDGPRPSSIELDEVHAFSLFGFVAARLKAHDLCVEKESQALR